jgi:hypothetical protein
MNSLILKYRILLMYFKPDCLRLRDAVSCDAGLQVRERRIAAPAYLLASENYGRSASVLCQTSCPSRRDVQWPAQSILAYSELTTDSESWNIILKTLAAHWCIRSLFGGVLVSVLAIGHKLLVQTRQRRWTLKGDKNPLHSFLRRGSKDVGPMS